MQLRCKEIDVLKVVAFVRAQFLLNLIAFHLWFRWSCILATATTTIHHSCGTQSSFWSWGGSCCFCWRIACCWSCSCLADRCCFSRRIASCCFYCTCWASSCWFCSRIASCCWFCSRWRVCKNIWNMVK